MFTQLDFFFFKSTETDTGELMNSSLSGLI